MKDASVLRKKHLPKKEEFFNDLTCQHITKDEYDFAQKVWNSFSCKKFQDYMEIYLLVDCLLLCDVFENFKSNCLQEYNIDPCYYFSAPHFTFDAFLRHSSLTLELLSDINWYLFIIKGIRGGMSMVSKRYALTNNKYVEGYNSSKSSSLDADVMTDNISCPTHFPKDKTECKVDSLNIYCENTLSQQGIHEELFTFTIYSISQNQVICTT